VKIPYLLSPIETMLHYISINHIEPTDNFDVDSSIKYILKLTTII